MSNTHHISLIAAAAVFFTFAAQAQIITVSTPADADASAVQEVQPPLSLMQAYVPVGATAAQSQLRLLVDDTQIDAVQPDAEQTAALSAPIAQADEIDGPAINALSPGRFAITVSQSSRPAR